MRIFLNCEPLHRWENTHTYTHKRYEIYEPYESFFGEYTVFILKISDGNTFAINAFIV